MTLARFVQTGRAPDLQPDCSGFRGDQVSGGGWYGAAESTGFCHPGLDGVTYVASGEFPRFTIGHATRQIGDGREMASAILENEGLDQDPVVRMKHRRLQSPR